MYGKENLEINTIDSKEELGEYIERNHSVDIAESFEKFDNEELLKLLELMNDMQKAEILEQGDESLQKRIFELIDDEEAIRILENMSPDDVADVLGYIDINKSKSILNKMKSKEANKIRDLLGYEEDSAGGIMTTRYIVFREDLEIGAVLLKIKYIAPKTEVIETIFTVNERNELSGEVDLRDILIASDETKLKEIMNENVISVYAHEDQEKVAQIASKYNLKVVPVINKRKNLLGIITIDDIIDVINEENTEDILKLGGASDEENINSEFTLSVKKRLPWLTVNLATAFMAAFTIGIFSETIDKVVALAATMPIVSGMGGNAGTQTLTITIRALALDEIDMKDTFKIVVKNFMVGMANGAFLGILCGIVVYALYRNIYLGGIIFLAMTGNLILACMIGFLVPITLKMLKIDPAMASAVLLTTVTDICGFFLFLGLATVFLEKLL